MGIAIVECCMRLAAKKYARLMLLLATLVIAYASIFISILLTPRFSWSRNALSDLGHSLKSRVAVIYNFGLATCGLLLALYSTVFLKNETKLAWLLFLTTGFLLQLVGVFDEVYGSVHGLVSVLFFAFFDLALLVYSIEKKSILGFLLFLSYIAVWAMYHVRILKGGVAVPELATSLIASVFFASSEIREIFSMK